MLSFSPGAIRIYAYTRPTDMRKGFDGLSANVRQEFQADPSDGSLFLFLNRRRDRLKLLHFTEGGFWLYYRLLEAGTFEELKAEGDSCRLQIDATQLSMLLSGVSLIEADKRRKRYVAPTKAAG
jgi:transposase